MKINSLVFYILLILLMSCNGEDSLEIRGLLNDHFKGSARSIVTAISIENETLTITGDNLDLIQDLALFNDSSPNALSTDIWLRGLKILSQTRTKIIATGRNENINLFFDGSYDLIRLDYNSPIEDVFPFVVIRKEREELVEDKIEDEIELEPRHLLNLGRDKEVIIYSAADQKWKTGPISGQLEYLGSWDPTINQTYSSNFGQAVSLTQDGTSGFFPGEK